MCGISGIIYLQSPQPIPAWLNDVHSALAHRGPDDDGWIATHGTTIRTGKGTIPQAPAEVAFLHRRLSILDLSDAGHQPMSTPDGRFHIVFNGEIYNYIELRDQLVQAGFRFQTGTDTEVLLHGFSHWSTDVFQRLIGMFAVAILDTAERKVVLARDCFGIKPLFYHHSTDRLIFASELSALLKSPCIRRIANPQAVFDYLRYGMTDHLSRSMFDDVNQLEPGMFLEVDLGRSGNLNAQRYWSLRVGDTLDISFREAADRIRDLFVNSVRLHLRSDVPVGMALSGGIDSSSIVAVARHVAPDQRFQTVSFVANCGALSEESWIDSVANRNRTESNKIKIAPCEMLDDLDDLIVRQGEPFGSTSIYAQYRVFQKAKDLGIRVMLDGQGADEMFAGYKYFLASRLSSLIRSGKICQAISLARRAASHSDVRFQSLMMISLGLQLPSNLRDLVQTLSGVGTVPRWLNKRWLAERNVQLGGISTGWETLRGRLEDSFTKGSLPSLLRFDDRNSMTHSVESRVPFLTPELVQFAFSIPESYLIDGQAETKSVFRAAMREIVDDEILDRRDKIGFATPESMWLGLIQTWAESVILSPSVKSIDVFARANLVEHVRQGFRSNMANRRYVWRWLNLIRWSELFDVAYD